VADESEVVEDPEVLEEDPAEPRFLPTSETLLGLIEPFEDVEYLVSAGQDVAMVPKAQVRAFAEAAKAAGFEMAVDVTAVDYLGKKRIRYEIVMNFLSVQRGARLRVRVPVGADDATLDSITPVYPGANFFEREVYDMFGIVFGGHPDMTRILMPDDWEGHPLRKDFSTGSVPVQFKEANQI
jgi:NADH-quinone oxidoreductase subunit C